MFKCFSVGEFHTLVERMLHINLQFNYVIVAKVHRQNTTATVKNSKYSKFDDKIFLIVIHECSTVVKSKSLVQCVFRELRLDY